MTSVIEDHTHNYSNIKGIQQHTYSLRSIANRSLNVCDITHHGRTDQGPGRPESLAPRVYQNRASFLTSLNPARLHLSSAF